MAIEITRCRTCGFFFQALRTTLFVSYHGDVQRAEEVTRKTAEFLNVPALGACSYLWALNGETYSE
jgi:hypothetical protein